MKDIEQELRKKWESIDYFEGGSIQLDIDHPLNWFVRYASETQKSIVIVSPACAEKIDSSKCIEISCNLRKDGKYAIAFTLINQDQEDVFITMATDIIQYSLNEIDQQTALEKVLLRYKAWMKLLDHKNKAFMSSSEQKGLIGELLFLKEILEKTNDLSGVLSGWGGPDGADQDFFFDECWFEIKTTGISSSSINVSSIEQLDNVNDGELLIYRVDKCVPTARGAFTLYKLVHSIFDIFADDKETMNAFIMKLGSVGYIDVCEYDEQTFVLSSKQVYHVDSTFPCLRREKIPHEIVNVKYDLSLQSIARWEKRGE